MKYLYCTCFLLITYCFFNKAIANHIVGGELELVHLEGFDYQLSLIQYRDAVQQENTVIEPYIIVRVFRKRDDQFMEDVILYFKQEENLRYAHPECTEDILKTKKVIYSATLRLDPSLFNDEQGYYVAWERCCRNNSIDNVVLTAPNTVGQTYYMEFPPVVKRGMPFMNSSPSAFAPLNEYACVGVKYEAQFGGVDQDGDSLAYRLVTPLDSSTDEALPDVSTAPYPLIPWKEGFDERSMVPGTPSLQIDQEGMLSVTPTKLGLFVFSVLCEEYRNGEKIGEVRRDFQLLVVDCPRQGTAPVLTINISGDDEFNPETDVAVIPGTQPNEERCLSFYIIDQENVGLSSIEAVPVNFSNTDQVFYIDPSAFEVVADTLKGKICFSPCPQLNELYLIDIIARDNACPFPLSDSLRLQVFVEPPENKPAYFLNSSEIKDLVVYAGDRVEIPVFARDDDSDYMVLSLAGVGFDTTGYGIGLWETVNKAGQLDAVFSWDLDCSSFNFADENKFTFNFLLKDMNPCDLGETDTLTFTLIVEDLLADFENFSMPNVFTPNGDGKNDFFEMCHDARCDSRYVLPPDNCQGKYEGIEIFNRWGRRVYEDNKRDFKWDGNGASTGVYYYKLKYTHKTINGHLSLLR